MKFGLRGSALFNWSLCFLLVVAAAVYFVHVPEHPAGFSIDESSICYNAYTISQTGRDEYGAPWPLFFRAFGEYKNPVLVYVLAALFRISGPSIAVARLLTASLGVLGGLLLGFLAWRMTRDRLTAAVVTITALLMPWLFESSRLVFEVAVYPAALALVLLAVWSASRISRWTWRIVVTLAVILALLTYSYSVGRLLAPLLALGLAFFASRERWRGIVATWIAYGLLLVPLFIFHEKHPEALTGRFKALTYLSADNSFMKNLTEFMRHYLANVNPWRWLFTGEGDIRDHLQGTGSLLAASVLLAMAGLVIVLRRHRQEAWWRFLLYCLVVSPVPASLAGNPFPQLRLVAFPVFFLLFMIPALTWLTSRRLLLVTAIVLMTAQGLFFQRLYHRTAPSLWYVFDGRFARKVLSPALTTGQRPTYLLDEPGKAGYIHALWYGVLAHLDATSFVRLPWGASLPPGAVVISTEQDCRDCRLIARALNYIVYSIPPYPEKAVGEKKALSSFQADIVCENPRQTLIGGQKITLSFLIKNISSAEWPAVGDVDGRGAVNLEGRWRDASGTILVDQNPARNLPYDVEPGDTVGLILEVKAPTAPGDSVLEVDLVQTAIARFSDRGGVPWTQKVKVTSKE